MTAKKGASGASTQTPPSSHEIRELEKLIASPGWQILKRFLQDDILAAALKMSSPNLADDTDLHFRRGALHATNNFLTTPDRLVEQLRNNLIISQSKNLNGAP